MITAELHDGRVLEFPDGTDPAVVQRVVKQTLGVADKPAAQAMSGAERMQMGLADPFHGGAQLLTKMLPDSVVSAGNAVNNWLADKTGLVAKLPEGGVDQQVRQREADYQQRKGIEGVDWLRLGGNMLSPANLAFGVAGSASTLPVRIGAGAITGGASSALAPVGEGDFAAEKAKQIGLGAVGGAVAPVLMAGVGRVVSPKASINPDVQMLRDAGVNPTIGQTLGGRMNALEEKLTSLPIMGDAISKARERSLEQFNKAAINRATAPVGETVNDVGQVGVSKAGDVLSDAYEAAKSQIGHVKFDAKFQQDLSQLKQMTRGLTPQMKKQFDTTVRDVVGGRTSPANAMLADTFKKVDSELGQKAARYGSSSVASEQELGDALKQVQALIREQAMRSNPKAAEALRAADEGWANLVRVEGAAKIGKNHDGIFTPGQLNTAIQTADRSVRKRAVSRGEALMQDLANAGQNVLGNKVPNSFTTDRALIAGGGLGAYLLDPMIPASLIGGAAMYTPLAQSMLRGAVASRPSLAQPIAGLLNQSSPMFAPGAGLLGYQLVNQ